MKSLGFKRHTSITGECWWIHDTEMTLGNQQATFLYRQMLRARKDELQKITKESHRSNVTVAEIYTHCLLSIREIDVTLQGKETPNA
jgi:hypothetical protein